MSDNDTETNKINSNEDLTDEKSVFSRNVQAQKMFHDYYFDKTKCNQIPSSDTNRLKVMSDANANSEKTTKYTTLNSISKYP